MVLRRGHRTGSELSSMPRILFLLPSGRLLSKEETRRKLPHAGVPPFMRPTVYTFAFWALLGCRELKCLHLANQWVMLYPCYRQGPGPRWQMPVSPLTVKKSSTTQSEYQVTSGQFRWIRYQAMLSRRLPLPAIPASEIILAAFRLMDGRS